MACYRPMEGNPNAILCLFLGGKGVLLASFFSRPPGGLGWVVTGFHALFLHEWVGSPRTSPCRDFTRLRLQGSPEAGREVEGDCSDEEEWTISLPRPRPRSVGSGAFHRASNNRETQDDRSSVSSFRSVHSSHSMTLFDM
mgnify:CR=1 FL=1